MDLAVIMQTEPELFEDVLKYLRGEGFNPVALSNPVSGERYYPGSHPYSKTRPVVYITVPRDERAGVKMHLRKWQAAKMGQDEKVATGVRKNAFGTLIISVGLGLLLHVLLGDVGMAVTISAIVGVVVFLFGCASEKSSEDGDD